MTQTIEQLTTRVRELEEELERKMSAGQYVLEQLAAAQEEMNGWRNQAHQSQSAFDRLQDQLAKAEQRVAEACAEIAGWQSDGESAAIEIRRKFVKEV